MPSLPDASTLIVGVLIALAYIFGRRAGRHPESGDGHVAPPCAPIDAGVGVLAASLHRSIEQVRTQVADLDRRRVGADHQLVQQVRSLQRTTDTLSESMRSPKARGTWGELHLRRVVEAAGMLAHCDFVEQPTHVGADGTRSRPDLVVRMAGGRTIVVDAKTPMDSFLRAADAAGSEREELEHAHAARVRTHVRELASKRYAEAVGTTTALIVLFLPSEDLLRVALDRDPTLIEHAAANDIALATPTTLIAILRGVACGWREATLARDAAQMGQLGATLHERIVIVNDHLAKLGRALDTSVRGFDETVASLHSRLLPTARELERLGASASRPLEPAAPIDRVTRVPSEV